MPKKNSRNSSMRKSSTDWETVSTGGFSPMWKPTKAGEDVIFIPLSARVIPQHGKVKEGPALECELTGGGSDSFFSKDIKKGVANGEKFSMPLSHQLLGEDKLGTYEAKKGKNKSKSELSSLCRYMLSKRLSLRVVFDGKISGGGGKVKLFTIQVPRGVREALASKK